MKKQKKATETTVLVAPLNWGLGHATRCMPIIDQLLNDGKRVIIASDGRSLRLLQQEYPQLQTVELQSYDIAYNAEKGSFIWAMFRQIPQLLYRIYREHHEVQKIIQQFDIQVVISDNRYGCWSSHAYSVFMTHQVFIRLPAMLRWLQKPLFYINRWFMYRYDECWIPDYPEIERRLSGALTSQGFLDPKHFYFVGALSRFKPDLPVSKVWDLLIILSGPEPQRTIFWQKIKSQLLDLQDFKKILVVEGITEKQTVANVAENISVVSHLRAKALNEAILGAKIVVSRTGYSTIMDFAALGKTAILIPTPQQTEQEYLATYFKEKKIFYTANQSDFDLKAALDLLQNGEYKGIIWDKNKRTNFLLKKRLDKVVSLVQEKTLIK